eukprot:900710_1
MSSNPQATDNDGWTTKKTRQQKRNIKPKSNKQKPNQKKLTRKQRRKRTKNQSQNGFRSGTKKGQMQSVIQQITQCYPRFKSDRNILETVIQQMNLKAFDPNDHELKANVLECITRIKMDILTENMEDDQNMKLDDLTPHGPPVTQPKKTINNIQNDIDDEVDDEEEEEEDDEEEEEEDHDTDEEEEEEDEDEEEEEEDDEEESLEQKESSESPQKSVSAEDDKESKSSQRDEPQRKKKRKRARRRRKKEDDRDNKEEEEEEDEEYSPHHGSEDRNRSESPKTITKPKKKKKETLNDNLKSLDLSEVATSRFQLNEWLNLLQNAGENKAFLNAFAKANGIEIIVEKLVLNDSGTNNQYNSLIVSLFDILLCGTRDYHQWLFSKLIKLGQNLKDLNVNSQNNSGGHADLVSIITQQARSLIRAQTRSLRRSSEIVINRDESFSRPSHLLHGGHQEKDPIVPVLSSLDEEVSTLSDLYNTLLVHDSTFSSKVNYDLSGYASIKSVLRENMSIIQHKSASLEQQLFAMKNEQNELSKRKDMELMDIRQRLENRKSEKYRLLAEKKRIEAELFKINESLQKNDMLQEEANVAMLEITNVYSPKMESLYDSMHDHQFEIAGYAQESSCFSSLSQMTQESYNLLDSFRDNLDLENNQRRNELENNYINHLARYLEKLCDAAMMVCNRQNELKQHIESFKKTNETTNKYYALTLNISQQLQQYKSMLNVDERTNVNISGNICKNIEKAQKIVSKNLFAKFINHLKQNPQIAGIIDLAKYTKQNESNKKNAANKDKQTVTEHTHAAHTHTRTHAHPHSHSRSHQSHSHQSHSHAQQINGRSKPPFIKNKAASMRRPPRPHYTQQQTQNSKRRPPAHNKLYRQQF